MALQDIVKVEIAGTAAQVAQAGFGVPLILGVNPTWGERARAYSSAADMVADGMGAATPEYKAASALFAQSPRPERVFVGRRANKPTQRFKLSIAAVRNSTPYEVKVGANTASVTSGASATNDAIVASLVTAINGLAGDTLAASALGTAGSQYVQLLGALGSWDYVEVLDAGLLALEQDHVDPGLAADLDAILLENAEWYAILNPWNSKAEVLAIAAWAETNEKLFVAASVDTPIITAAEAGATDVAKAVKDAAYARTAVVYHPGNGYFADAAWEGRCLPEDPGSETWAYKTLAGVPATKLTGTQIANLKAKRANWFETVAGVNVTQTGRVGANEYLDVVRFRDWLKARIAERIFSRLAALRKIPFTDQGIAIVEAEVRAQLREGVAVGGLASNPEPTVTVPKAADVSQLDRAARLLPNVEFTAQLAGAIHSATPIRGVVAV